MYCGTNRTAMESQRQISRTLMELMSTKPYAQVTVTELCRTARISRQTFYSLFTSTENVVVYTIRSRYETHPSRSPEAPCGDSGWLCREYALYITRNRDFIRLLVNNNIIYLLHDSIFSSLLECSCFLPGSSEAARHYAADFLAGGITGVARSYALDGCHGDAVQLEQLLLRFLQGHFA